MFCSSETEVSGLRKKAPDAGHLQFVLIGLCKGCDSLIKVGAGCLPSFGNSSSGLDSVTVAALPFEDALQYIHRIEPCTVGFQHAPATAITGKNRITITFCAGSQLPNAWHGLGTASEHE